MIQVNWSSLLEHESVDKKEFLRAIFGSLNTIPLNYQIDKVAEGVIHVYWKTTLIGIAIGKANWQAEDVVFDVIRLYRARPTRMERWMKANYQDYLDCGEVNCTALAEAAADEFHCDEFLDDDTHYIWDLAAKDYGNV